jgi:hypothetical protein
MKEGISDNKVLEAIDNNFLELIKSHKEVKEFINLIVDKLNEAIVELNSIRNKVEFLFGKEGLHCLTRRTEGPLDLLQEKNSEKDNCKD